MKFRIMDAALPDDRARWRSIVEERFDGEPMLLPDYARLFCGGGDSALCALGEEKEGCILYAFIKRAVPGHREYCDLTTPYGYGGPVMCGETDAAGVDMFWHEFGIWCENAHAVSEFVRFMLDANAAGYPGSRVENNLNIVCSLSADTDKMLAAAAYKVRKNLRHAREAGLSVEIDTKGARLDEYLEIYTATMDRRDAERGYYFDRSFYSAIHENMAGHFAYFFTMLEGRAISCELALHSRRRMYSYLGGTLSEFFPYRPNELLKLEMMNWGAGMGIEKFVLGGGYHPEDGIYRYKKAFAPDGVVPFYVGRRVLDEAAYKLLCAEHGVQSADFFPLYRAAGGDRP